MQNLARALDELGSMGFTRVGLDSEAETPIEEAMAGARIALVLGAEGKGLRRLTRDTCDRLARLTVPGAIASLNVSNAAVLALYLARRHLRLRRRDGTFAVPVRLFSRQATTGRSAKQC